MTDRRYGDTRFGSSPLKYLQEAVRWFENAIFWPFQPVTAENFNELLSRLFGRISAIKPSSFFQPTLRRWLPFRNVFFRLRTSGHSANRFNMTTLTVQLRHYITSCFCKKHSFTTGRRALWVSLTVIYKVTICGLHDRRLVTVWHGLSIHCNFAECTTFYGLSAL